MGQKVNPINFRLQVHKNWSSRWFTANKKEFAEAIRQDHEIRELIEKKFASRPTINRIEIERSANLITDFDDPDYKLCPFCKDINQRWYDEDLIGIIPLFELRDRKSVV